MANVRLMNCCGLAELWDLSDGSSAKASLTSILLDTALVFRPRDGDLLVRRGAVMFTSNTVNRSNYASKFVDYITKNKLGEVIEMPRFRNPNTGNTITVFMWIIDAKAVLAYCKKEGIQQHADILVRP